LMDHGQGFGPPWTLVLGAAAQDIGPPEFSQINAMACRSSPRGVWEREADDSILTSYQGRRQSGYLGQAMKLKVVAGALSMRLCFKAPLIAAMA
jgi:hypothetical protein